MRTRFKEKSVLFAVLIIIACVAVYFLRTKPDRPSSASGLEKSGNSYGNGFEALTLDGERFTLSTLFGKPIIVHFWASWCGPCVNEFPKMIRFVESFKGQIHLVTLSADQSDEDIRAFLKKTNVNHEPFVHFIRDEGGKIAKQYLAKMLPTSVILGKDLKVIKRLSGEVDWEDGELNEVFTKFVRDN